MTVPPEATTPGALAGHRVLDLSRLAPGPMATMILADLGADVIKIEEPGGGRRAREERERRGGGPSAETADRRWRALNPLERNKRSIEIDLRKPGGREILLRLARDADVVVEGFRPGVVARLGVDYDTLRATNPRIVYCSISGFGQQGVRARRPGHDLTYLAYAGALSLIGTADGEPVVPVNVVADYAAGSLNAVVGILAALIARASTGKGQFVDISMADGVLGLVAVEVARLLSTGAIPRAGTTYLTGGVAYYNVYRLADGRTATLACNEPHFFANLCELLGLPELVERQFADPAGQKANFERIQARLLLRPLDEWVELCNKHDVPFEPVRTLDEVLGDPDLAARGMFASMPHDDFGEVRQVASPIHLSATPPQVRRLAPTPGEDTAAIMREAGYTDQDVSRLRSDGTIGAIG